MPNQIKLQVLNHSWDNMEQDNIRKNEKYIILALTLDDELIAKTIFLYFWC